MEGTMGNEGVNKLAMVMQGRMKSVTEKPVMLDIGQINGDMSLTTNQFPQTVPQSDYLVCRQLTLGKVGDIFAKTQEIGQPHAGSHIHKVGGTVGEETSPAPDPPDPPQKTAGSDGTDGGHQHHVIVPEKMRSIKPGDRVLVAWVGDDACIIDIILPGTAVVA